VGGEPDGELLLLGSDLLVQAAKGGHQGFDHLAAGPPRPVPHGQLQRRQPIVDSDHPSLQVAAPTSWISARRTSARVTRRPSSGSAAAWLTEQGKFSD
jgi:hypothetical protein